MSYHQCFFIHSISRVDLFLCDGLYLHLFAHLSVLVPHVSVSSEDLCNYNTVFVFRKDPDCGRLFSRGSAIREVPDTPFPLLTTRY
jgi:hypothetical protein